MRRLLASTLVVLALSCASSQLRERDAIDAECREMLTRLACDVSTRGPLAWPDWIDDAPGFFMVVFGALEFPDRDSLVRHVTELAPTVESLGLEWSDLRIEVHGPRLASVVANYSERVRLREAPEQTFSGCFTGLLHRTPEGWRLRNAHWSTPVPSPSTQEGP